jgi:prepilin-type N-terminal cleavage/methylation domain-containing protein
MNKKGFTLVELLAVIVILAVIILIAITAVLPQMDKARRNSFADEVLSYAKAAESKLVTDSTVSTEGGADAGYGKCYDIASEDETKALTGEYISKKDANYKGIVIIKKKSSKSSLFEKYVFLTNNKYHYNSTTALSDIADTKSSLGQINYNDITEGKSLTFNSCQAYCDAIKAVDSSYDC